MLQRSALLKRYSECTTLRRSKSSSSNDMPSDGFKFRIATQGFCDTLIFVVAGPMETIPVGAARTALLVSGKSSSAMVAYQSNVINKRLTPGFQLEEMQRAAA